MKFNVLISRMLNEIDAYFANIGKTILRQYWLNDIGQYCENVDIPILVRYCLQYRTNIANNLAPIPRQYCLLLGYIYEGIEFCTSKTCSGKKSFEVNNIFY